MNNWLIGKDPNTGKDWRWEEKKAAEDKMVRYHHQLNVYEFEQTLGDSEGWGSLEILRCRNMTKRFKVLLLLFSCSVLSDSFWPHGLELARLLYPGDFPDKNTGVGYHFLLQGMLGLNPHLLHCRWILYCWVTREADKLKCIFKSRDITLSTKVCIVKATVFQTIMYRCESGS